MQLHVIKIFQRATCICSTSYPRGFESPTGSIKIFQVSAMDHWHRRLILLTNIIFQDSNYI